MRFNAEVKVDFKDKETIALTKKSALLALRDTVVLVHRQTLENAVALGIWRTGNNNRSIAGEISGMGCVATGGEGGAERQVNEASIEGALYSTSGYGGYHETGTVKMAARPYFYPALIEHFTEGKFAECVRRYLK